MLCGLHAACRCNLHGINAAGAGATLTVSFTTNQPYVPPPPVPGVPAPPTQACVPAVTATSAVLTIWLVPGATSYYIWCTGVNYSWQYAWQFYSGYARIAISSLSPATTYT